jgi:hypothetical protein
MADTENKEVARNLTTLREFLKRLRTSELETVAQLYPWFPEGATIADELLEKRIPPFRP